MTTTYRPGTARWLAANGHPGYSPTFARNVWTVMMSQFDTDDIATCSVNRYSGMVWAGVAWVRNGWTLPTAEAV